MRYTTDNTEGYTEAELTNLNQELKRRAGRIAFDRDEIPYQSNLDHVAERVLADYDAGRLFF